MTEKKTKTDAELADRLDGILEHAAKVLLPEARESIKEAARRLADECTANSSTFDPDRDYAMAVDSDDCPCPECGGDGWDYRLMPSHRIPCCECNGTGVVSDPTAETGAE